MTSCLNCNQELTGHQQKYCSRSCAAKINNKVPKRKKAVIAYCLQCKKQIDSRNHKFCSRDCDVLNRQQYSFSMFLEGKLVQTEAIKTHLISIAGHECSICGLIEWQGQPAPLVMDHINGDSTDNSVLNLRLVCGNCDMQLPTYKAKNKGNGRKSRRVSKLG